MDMMKSLRSRFHSFLDNVKTAKTYDNIEKERLLEESDEETEVDVVAHSTADSEATDLQEGPAESDDLNGKVSSSAWSRLCHALDLTKPKKWMKTAKESVQEFVVELRIGESIEQKWLLKEESSEDADEKHQGYQNR